MSHRYVPPPPEALRWVEEIAAGRVVGAVRLVGGITAHMDRITIATGRGRVDVVLRRWPRGGAGLVQRESAARTAMAGEDVPAPRLLGAGAVDGVQCLLMSALPGEPLLAPPDPGGCVRSMARTLAEIHAVPAPLEPTDPHYLRDDADLGWVGDAALVRDARAAAAEALTLPADVLVHGDYQQLNILWHNGKLSGVVDWTYAGRGRKEIDVGHCRLALAALFSAQAADDFLGAYEAEAGTKVDPRGDIRALLTFGPNWTSVVPRQLAGRVQIDTAGMVERVATALRGALGRL